MEVFLSELAEQKLKKLNDYLLEKWSYEVKKDFLAKLTAKIEHIVLFP
jgi:plasmid stabilization system protein ParE